MAIRDLCVENVEECMGPAVLCCPKLALLVGAAVFVLLVLVVIFGSIFNYFSKDSENDNLNKTNKENAN